MYATIYKKTWYIGLVWPPWRNEVWAAPRLHLPDWVYACVCKPCMVKLQIGKTAKLHYFPEFESIPLLESYSGAAFSQPVQYSGDFFLERNLANKWLRQNGYDMYPGLLSFLNRPVCFRRQDLFSSVWLRQLVNSEPDDPPPGMSGLIHEMEWWEIRTAQRARLAALEPL